MKNLFSALALLTLVTGCATSPIPLKEAMSVPAERVLRHGELNPDGHARAVFVRDVGATAGGVYQHLFIDGEQAALLNPGEKVEFFLAPGEHILGVIPTDPLGVSTLNSVAQDMKAGRSYFYRIQTTGDSFITTLQRFLPDVR